jgi:hypothetical protein
MTNLQIIWQYIEIAFLTVMIVVDCPLSTRNGSGQSDQLLLLLHSPNRTTDKYSSQHM